MSYKGSHQINGYFSYVVPPLEGLWQQNGGAAIDNTHKEHFVWTSMIRLPEFVTKADFDWIFCRKMGIQPICPTYADTMKFISAIPEGQTQNGCVQ